MSEHRYRGKHSEETDMAERAPRRAGRAKKRRLTARQKWLVAACAVLAVALLAVIAYRLLFVKPELPTPSAGGTSEEQIDYGDGVQPRVSGERKSQDYYTVLILGRDTGGGGNTDTMLLASYDVTNQKATVMSIPRDTMVNVPWDIKRINSVYNANGQGDKGIKGLYKEISQLVGFAPDYQVVVEWEAVGQIVEAMGGVWFDVPQNMDYDDPLQDLAIHQTAGYRLLSGSDAMQVLRYRHDNKKNGVMKGYPDGDLGRIKTQQAFLKAMVQQLLQLKNLTKVNQFVKVFNDCVETDLSLQNILWFAQSAYLGGLSADNVNFVTMPNTPKSCYSRSVGNMQSYVVPNPRELLDLVNTSLSPFTEQFTLRDLDIMSINADGSVSSSTGHVEDSRAAVAPVIPSDTPEEEAPPSEGETGGETADPGSGGETADPGAGGEGTEPGGTGGETTPPDAGGETIDPGAGGETGAPADPELPAEPAPLAEADPPNTDPSAIVEP